MASEQEDKYVTYALAMSLFGVNNSTMTRLLASGELPYREHPFDKRKKLIKLTDVEKLRGLGVPADATTHHTVMNWIISALVDPRDDSIHYVGRTIETERRLQQHLQELNINKDKSAGSQI